VWWAVRSPDLAHPYPVPFKGGTIWYFSYRVGWFIDNAMLILVGLVAAVALVEWISTLKERTRQATKI